MNSAHEFISIFSECRSIAVVGASANPARPSNGVASFMQAKGYRVIPVNPNETEVLGEKCYDSLYDVPVEIDLVNIFRRPEFAGEAVDGAIAVGAKAVWMQEGVVDADAAERAAKAGLKVVMDRCWLKEWHRYGK